MSNIESFDWWESGKSSSKITKSIVPAEKESSHGSKRVMCEVKKNPKTAKMGSAIPLNVPSKKDFVLLFVQLYIGSAVASPSGMFCKAIPTATAIEEKERVLVEMALPTANPTIRPSGML